MTRAGRSAVSALTCAMAAIPAWAEPKDAYTIFNPTPDQLLRELTTDRPDTTESPFTIDAGRIQLETTIAGYARSRTDALGSRETSFGSATNMRIGLTNSAEIDIAWQPYGVVDIRNPGPGGDEHRTGSGGLDIRAKFNVWGNDAFNYSGATSLALLPFVTLPTDRRNGIGPARTEGGLIVPLAINLPADFALSVNTGIARADDGNGAGYSTKYLASTSLSYEWTSKIGTYYELAAELRRGRDIVTANTGVTYKLTPDIQLDAGINLGMTTASDRIETFVGMSQRF